MVLFSKPRDKLKILTLAKRMYPGETDWFRKRYEEAMRRPFDYLFVHFDLKPTTQDSHRLRTNVLPDEEKLAQSEAGFSGTLAKQTFLRCS